MRVERRLLYKRNSIYLVQFCSEWVEIKKGMWIIVGFFVIYRNYGEKDVFLRFDGDVIFYVFFWLYKN